MLTDNIFKLLKKVSKDEDQLSASFGFLLKEDLEILNNFLKKLGITLSRHDLKRVDIEALVPYVFRSKRSNIDLQIEMPGRFLIFIESKIVPTKIERILKQIKPYNDILKNKEVEYEGGTRLVYVARDTVNKQQIEMVQRSLRRPAGEFLFFSWESLLAIVANCKRKNRRIIELFNNYIGDTMHSKKIISEQKIKNISDVLVIFTNPAFWEMTKQKDIAVQKKSSPDARYIAFLRTHLGKGQGSGITHIAEVNYTEIRPRKEMFEGLNAGTKKLLTRHIVEERGGDPEGAHKVYFFKKGSLRELPRKIDHCGNRGRVKFRAKMSDLLCARTTREIKTDR